MDGQMDGRTLYYMCTLLDITFIDNVLVYGLLRSEHRDSSLMLIVLYMSLQ